MTTNAAAGNGETTYGPEWLGKGRLEAIIRRLAEDPRYFISNRLAKVLVPALLSALHADGGKVEAVLHSATAGVGPEWLTDERLEGMARRLRSGCDLGNELARLTVDALRQARGASRDALRRWEECFGRLTDAQQAIDRLRAERDQLSAAARRLESSLRKGDDLVSRQSAHIKAQDEIIRRMGRENEALNAQLEATPAAEVWADDDTATLPAGDYAGDCPPEPPSAFRQVCDEVCATHDRKRADYGTEDDPFANIRAAADFGVPAWAGAAIRGNDKMKRIQAFLRKGRLENESLEDSILDWAVYGIICLVLYRESVASHAGSEKKCGAA